MRTALGAAPRQIITQLLAESLILSIAGAVAGDTRNSLWALLLLAISLPAYALVRYLTKYQNRER